MYQMTPLPLDPAELEKLERQLIPLLNTVRRMQGKQPMIAPRDNEGCKRDRAAVRPRPRQTVMEQ